RAGGKRFGKLRQRLKLEQRMRAEIVAQLVRAFRIRGGEVRARQRREHRFRLGGCGVCLEMPGHAVPIGPSPLSQADMARNSVRRALPPMAMLWRATARRSRQKWSIIAWSGAAQLSTHSMSPRA